MYEPILSLETIQMVVKQVLLLAAIFLVLTLVLVFLLLFSGDFIRARKYEVISRRKSRYDMPEKTILHCESWKEAGRGGLKGGEGEGRY